MGGSGGGGFEIAGCLTLIGTGHGAHFAPGVGDFVAAVEAHRVAVLVERKGTALVPMGTSEEKVKADIDHQIPPSWDDRWQGMRPAAEQMGTIVCVLPASRIVRL